MRSAVDPVPDPTKKKLVIVFFFSKMVKDGFYKSNTVTIIKVGYGP
jgi:hypothetical protein